MKLLLSKLRVSVLCSHVSSFVRLKVCLSLPHPQDRQREEIREYLRARTRDEAGLVQQRMELRLQERREKRGEEEARSAWVPKTEAAFMGSGFRFREEKRPGKVPRHRLPDATSKEKGEKRGA